MSMNKLNTETAQAMLKMDNEAKKRTIRDSQHFQPLMVAFLCFGFATFLSVYILYYMKVFLDVYHISTVWIQIVQALFLVWNAVNDPLMGYMQDIGCCGMTWIMDRRKVLLYSTPVFAFSYMIFWFPWSTTNTVITGLHLLFGLFLFDTISTLVFSAYCGILVEACPSHSQRVRCLVNGDLFIILGGLIIYPLNVYSNEAKDFGRFQLGCAVIAVIGAVSMSGGAYFLEPKKEHELHEEIELAEEPEVLSKEPESAIKKAAKVSWQIVREPRFIFMVVAQFMRSMRTVATGAFQMILVDALVSRPGFMESGSPALSAFYSFGGSLGSILFMCLWKPLAILGTHKMILILLGVALVNVIIALFLGRSDPLLVIVYIGIESISASAGGYSFGMLLAGEVIDTDAKTHKRKSPLSTLIFTLKALFTNPAEQLSPLIFISLLERGGFSEHRASCIREAPKLVTSLNNATMQDATTTVAPMLDLESPVCTTLLDTMHSSMLYFTLFFTIGEIIVISADYWYKKRVLKEEDIKKTPFDMPLGE